MKTVDVEWKRGMWVMSVWKQRAWVGGKGCGWTGEGVGGWVRVWEESGGKGTVDALKLVRDQC